VKISLTFSSPPAGGGHLSLKSQLRATGEREVGSELLGNLIMKALKELDKVAYVRFASVYRSFEDIREFGEEIARLGD